MTDPVAITEVPSFCYECYNNCPVRVQVQDGIIVRVEGNPKAPHTGGRLCPKGQAALMRVYDPHRVKAPLKRTNPEKGIGVDPQWQEVTWDEALDAIAARLKHLRQVNPGGLKLPTMELPRAFLAYYWGYAFGTHYVGAGSGTGGGVHCGNSVHNLGSIVWESYHDWPEYEYTRYALFIGTNTGFESDRAIPVDAKRIADARLRGMKLVVVDPRFTNTAAKADEWVPIRPGTDAALVLAIINLLLNEYGIYDAPFLRGYTNAPYLIGPDGHYVREPVSSKPLLWNEAKGQARPYDEFRAENAQKAALLGEYTVGEVRCRPAFALLKEHVRGYTPEWAEGVTTVPAATIRRIAREFGEAAQIGSSIEIEGESWPLRPVLVTFYRGTQGHVHSSQTTMAIYALQMIVGSLGVPGGTNRFHAGGLRLRDTLSPEGPDGLTEVKLTSKHPYVPPHWPPREYDLHDFFPLDSVGASHLHHVTGADPAKWGLHPEMVVFNENTNPVMSVGEPEVVASHYRNAFVVVLDQYLTETAQLADYVLPSCFPVERHNLVTVQAGTSYLGLVYARPAIEPRHQSRDFLDILIELAERVGFLHGEGGFNYWVNLAFQLKPEYALGLEERFSCAQILERMAKNVVGEAGWQTLERDGVLPRRVTAQERYMPYRQHRVPLYQELLLKTGEELKAGMERVGAYKKMAAYLDFSDYAPLPSWKPGPIHDQDDTYDLYAVNGKSVLFAYSRSAFNPWLMEVAERVASSPLRVWMHPATAQRKTLRDGQRVWVESAAGRVPGQLQVTQGIHPECVGIASTLGHWCDHPIARGRGTHFNSLLKLDLSLTNAVFTTMQGTSCRVRVYPA